MKDKIRAMERAAQRPADWDGRWPPPKGVRNRQSLGLSLSPGLIARLREAAHNNERGISAEVEARLRKSLKHDAGHELVLLNMDYGLFSWLKALSDDLFGDFNDTVIHMLRIQVQDMVKSDVWFTRAVERLPEPIRGYLKETPRWQNLGKQKPDR